MAPGDRILVDRLKGEPGSSLKLDRVLLLNRDGEIRVGNPTIDGLDVEARVIAHPRGPRLESIRFKSKKRVRVHRGGRADLTALEIVAVGGVGVETEEKAEEVKPRGRRKPAPKKKAAEPKAEAPAEVAEVEEKPKRRTARAKKETG